MRRRDVLCALPALALAGRAAATEAVWRWIWVAPDFQHGWTTFEGEAPAQFDGRLFETLIEGRRDDWQPRLAVKGLVSGRRARMAVVQLGTDASPQTVEGVYSRVRIRAQNGSDGWGEDRIDLAGFPGLIGYLSFWRRTGPAD